MQKVKVDWSRAAQISRCYSLIATRITAITLLLIACIAAIVLKMCHIPISKALLSDFFHQYRNYIIISIAVFHLGPSNLYAIMHVFQYRFSDFTVAALPNKESIKEGESENHCTPCEQ